MKIRKILITGYPDAVVDALLEAYREIEENHFLHKWKASELDAGHFVEAARRMLEHKLLGSATALGTSLPNFHDAELKRYERASGDESLRILIPRILWSVYGIRNKRGVGHVGPVSPNQMDSSLILGAVKWVLAEFIRLESGLSTSDTQQLVDEIIERRLDLIWKHGDVVRVQDTRIKAKDQVLLLLYDNSPQKAGDLRAAIEYKNEADFRKILKTLHKARLIEYSATSGDCVLTSKGIIEAEAIARRSVYS